MANLTFVLEDGHEVVVPLADHITLGRGEDNDVVVDDDRVSKRHAELVRNADGSIQLFDSNSTAGTFVNGERIHSRTIYHGDKLTFGPLTAVLDFADHAANDSPPAPAQAGDKTQVVTIDQPVKADKIATRNRSRGGRPDSTAQLEMDKELHNWREQSAAEHAMHLALMESLRAEEEKLREQLCDLEHKLAELRDNITRAERQSSDLRQQAVLAEKTTD
jgi:pSer/pThr/pTyr-binding forkhead associated (FHA) protein